MRLLDRTIVTGDEEYNAEQHVAEQVELALKTLKMDTYNNIYVVKITVDTIDPPLKDNDDETDSA